EESGIKGGNDSNNDQHEQVKSNTISDGLPVNDTEVNNNNNTSYTTKPVLYARAVTNMDASLQKKLVFKPTGLNDSGKEVVIFDDDLVRIGSAKWQLTVIGFFVGFKMFAPELRYHLRRMWGKFGLKDVIVNTKGQCFFKFNNEEEAVEPSKVPVWVKVYNVPLEAWFVEGLSAIASSIGKPIVMDSMTAIMCSNGMGRFEYARVLVEIDAKKEVKEEIELQYRGKDGSVRGYKKVQVEYCWKPPVCTLCYVFGHDLLHCKKRERTEEALVEIKQQNNLKEVSNKFSVLEEEENDEVQELNMLKDRMLVDKYLNKKIYPSKEEMSLWTADMRMYFEKQWEIDRQKEIKDAKIGMEEIEEDVIDNTPLVDKILTANEDWISNSSHSGSGCRIVVRWNNSRVNVIPIITCRQCLFCAIENLNNGKKLFCSFVYAANSGIERRAIWKVLYVSKGTVVNQPWMLLGDFNVTLKVEEHSTRGSFMSQDMNEFRECVNKIEVEDVYCSGLFYTCIKSPSKPSTSILRKLDKVLANEEFISSFSQAHAKFLPYLVSDHSPVVCCIPNVLIKKVAKKLKLLKPYMNKINWKNGNLFDNVVKFREKLKELQTLVDSDPHNVDLKKAKAGCFNEYRTAIQDECKLLHQQAKVEWLSEGDIKSAYFHKIVKSRKHSSRIIAVYDDAGKSSPVDQLEDMSSLFTNKLTSEDTNAMLLPVTDKEIQEAIFDIGDNKAPGPDSYTAKFFKKAWKIVGEDVCLAVREFFQTGKLLGQINATLISLVPKIKQPRKVTDYRPIACCNVLYKCISKILTNRIKGSLNKLVSINQSAFILGRSIQDNIFITQELLKGFPVKMIQWIMTCVSSAAFTISVNGERFGYFKGGRGLRQGDPISPYLFTLELKLTHLSFADDLLVLCHGDLKSVSVLKKALNEFSKVFGLLPNINKSIVFFGNVDKQAQRAILDELVFVMGKLSVKYLGVPLITKKISVAECKILMDRVKNVVLDWKNKSLSYAGRLQLISSVLASMQVYWASVFLIPKTNVRDIEKGGLGLKKLDEWNETLLSKQIWKIATKKESLWFKWVNLVKLKGRNFWDVQSDVNDSWMWKVILDLR
nr:hypothetical protein [Tanacetum cinerariifolium]